MSSTNKKLQLAGALACLVTLGVAMSCTGFFPNPTVTAITITPTNPTVPYGGATQLTAFATFDDGSSGNVTGKLSWSSANDGAITVSSGGLLSGVVTAGATIDTSPVEIDALSTSGIKQSVNATVCVEGGSNFQIVPADKSVTGAQSLSYTASATATVDQVVTTDIDITSGVQWSSNNTDVTIANGTTPVTATIADPTSQITVLITATYTCNGVTNSFSTNLTVSP